MKDVLATASLFTGFAGLVAAIWAAATFVGASVVMPALLGLADDATSVDMAARLAG